MRICRVIGCSLLLAVVCMAATPVARVTSSGNFRLRGAVVRPASVPVWPVMAGDAVETQETPAAVTFGDGSWVLLGEASRVRLMEAGGRVSVHLETGAAKYELTNGSGIQIFQAAVPVTEPQGSIAVGTDAGAAKTKIENTAVPRAVVRVLSVSTLRKR